MKDVIKKPTPPFNKQTALEKVKLAEDAWNTRDPEKYVSLIHLIHNGEIVMSF